MELEVPSGPRSQELGGPASEFQALHPSRRNLHLQRKILKIFQMQKNALIVAGWRPGVGLTRVHLSVRLCSLLATSCVALGESLSLSGLSVLILTRGWQTQAQPMCLGGGGEGPLCVLWV